jgi:hypothetical protein
MKDCSTTPGVSVLWCEYYRSNLDVVKAKVRSMVVRVYTICLLRLLVLGRNTLKRDNEVLKGSLLLVLLGRLAVHKVVKASAALHEVVETTHDTEDTEGENPDTDDSDNAGLATNEPTKDTEEGGKDIDDKDGAGKLPRGDRRPEGTVGTGDEDQPVLSKRDLEEENLVDLTEVLDNTTVLRVGVHGSKGDPGTNSQDNTEKNGHTPELGKVPLDGCLGEGSVVVGNGKGGDIGEDSNEDNKLNVERSVKDSDPKTKEDLHTVDNVGVHTKTWSVKDSKTQRKATNRWKICLEVFKASMIAPRPGARKTMSEADRAASEAPSTAIPVSAFFREGASLTPSPVIATR